VPERTGKILRISCLLLAVLVVYQLSQMVSRMNPLRHVVIPPLPTLAADNNAAPQAGGPVINSAKPAAGGTNKPVEAAKTNSLPLKSTNEAEPNPTAAAQVSKMDTNAATGETVATNSTNLVIDPRGVTGANSSGETNASAAPTGAPDDAELEHVADSGQTNLVATTNVAVPLIAAGTNNSVSNSNSGTNAAFAAKAKMNGTNSNGRAALMLAGMGGNPPGMGARELPPEIKARVDRIYDSEILGQVMRPLPMGLIGIAGDVAFLRSASGQTGLIKEGDNLGDLKLLRIGINRVLVEQAGQKQELMIFEGYGGKSLLPEKGTNQNENTNN
jgi:hypothetical protein